MLISQNEFFMHMPYFGVHGHIFAITPTLTSPHHSHPLFPSSLPSLGVWCVQVYSVRCVWSECEVCVSWQVLCGRGSETVLPADLAAGHRDEGSAAGGNIHHSGFSLPTCTCTFLLLLSPLPFPLSLFSLPTYMYMYIHVCLVCTDWNQRIVWWYLAAQTVICREH